MMAKHFAHIVDDDEPWGTALRHIERLLGRNTVIMHQGVALGDHIGCQHAADPTCQ